MKKFRILVMLAVLVALIAGTANSAVVNAAGPDTTGWPTTFIFGIFGGEDVGKALTAAEPLRVRIETELQKVVPTIRVVMYTGTSYSAVIEAMKAGRIDAFEVGPFAYVLAAQEANAEALVIGTPENRKAKEFNKDTKTYYLSTIITKKGSGVKTIADLKGKSFSFVDPASTSGHLMPASIIMAAGINPDTDMKTVYAGSHPASVLAVQESKVEAGATFIGNLFTQLDAKKIDLCYFKDNDQFAQRTEKEFADLYDSCKDGQIVPIAFSAPIPSTPFAIRRDLPDTFKATLKDILLSTQKDAEFIKAYGAWYIDPTQEMGLKALDEYYNSLRDVAKILGLDLKSIVK